MLAQGMRANVFESQRRLVDVQTCIGEVFEGERKPSLRTFRKWQALGLIPFHKIGRLTYFDPSQVRAALDKRCRIEAI